jgi:hypothetical protein
MRRSIETLALWYIPVWILMAIFSGYYTDYFQALIESHPSSHAMVFSVFLARLVGVADHFVVAIWLMFQKHENNWRKTLWFVFGVVSGLIGAVIYLLVKIYEEKHNAFNNKIQPTR